ncbi:acetone carboxylase [Glutamicibacter sp. MNS18]|uniref:acetone carboxylase n=1 Tax=Glutamicibacter sp. MNS18 TaxID=2989817 RepID=UPI002235B5C3|nr:acetone carboxylase [Glutamicibacter sp. MNS18]MCW4464944.1 acetone carboxylase [Glutamicibacter sp. MNS18]
MDLLSSLGGAPVAERLVCSRKGCRDDAAYKLLWNNPKIHTPERRKTWLACPGHRDWLETYLRERLLYKQTLPIQDAAQPEAAPSTDDAAKE